jgi:hypothetical protein
MLATRTRELLDAGSYAEAEPVARECLAVRQKQIPDDWRTFNARSMLGGALLGQKKYGEETEAMLLSGYKGMEQRENSIPSEGRLRPREALQRLVQFYEATSRPDQAAEWKRTLAGFDQAELVQPGLVAQSIPARDPAASTNLIDLTSLYNATLTAVWHEPTPASNDLSELPRGIQTFAAVQFDVRGLIQLSASLHGLKRYPDEVRDIPIHRTCRRLHFLHATIFGDGAPDGAKIGSYIVHYASGTQSELPIIIGQSLADWWTQPGEQDKTFTLAWVGHNPESRRQGKTIRLFKSTWENLAPGETVSTIDFVAIQPGPAPFLVAITSEP